MPSIETIFERSVDESTGDSPSRGFLHRPDNPNGDGLVLTHGAGANCQAPLLIAVAEAFADAGFTVLRCDLSFRQVRSFGPPGPGDAERDRVGLKHAAAKLRTQISGRLFLGGHSYGGRQASMLCAEEAELASGLLLLSYPLHPPRKPAQLRTQHFTNLVTPALFVQGTRDPFGTMEELESALKLIRGKTLLLEVGNAGHDLGFKGKSKREGLAGGVVEAFRRLHYAEASLQDVDKET
jgi:predicted alpha/beta-hydrolase family hydrolase